MLVLVVLVFGYVVKGCVPCVPGTANDGTGFYFILLFVFVVCICVYVYVCVFFDPLFPDF